jgi:hypothetical protein
VEAVRFADCFAVRPVPFAPRFADAAVRLAPRAGRRTGSPNGVDRDDLRPLRDLAAAA